MYIKVRLLTGWKEPLVYKIPDHWENKNLAGTIVTVPLQKKTAYAFVEEVTFGLSLEQQAYTVREALSCVSYTSDAHYKKFITQLSAYYGIEQRVFYRRICASLYQEDKAKQDQLTETYWSKNKIQQEDFNSSIELTSEQKLAVDTIVPALKTPHFQPHVLQGVTGSGKTEVYAELIHQAYLENKTTILLLPEVSLAVQFINFFKKRFKTQIPVFGFHSSTPIPEKRALWESMYQRKPLLLIGVHLPILLPVIQLGLIIIDEEHESGYQEKKHPKINTKEAALMRASIEQIPIVLGSATPSISTLHNIKTKNWKLSTLTQRFKGAFPKIQVVPLKKEERRPHFWLSNQLLEAIHERIQKGEQALIFLNRRGYSFFVQCADCGHIFKCNSCSVSLTLHESNILRCHYCGLHQNLARACSSCKSIKLLKKGIGTQQVVTLLQEFFPQARIERADLDSTTNKKKWQKTIEAFSNQELDILVGTQTITKGYHFPHITLVGILWADMHLGFPMYNATETTIQQLIQVAGRAGRHHPESLVIIQTMIDHPVLKYVNEVTYNEFYEYELEQRAQVSYPPFIRFAEIELRHPDESTVEKESDNCADFLHDYIYQNKLKILVLGPSQPLVHKIKNIHVRKIYLKGQSIQELIKAYTTLDKSAFRCNIFFTPNPLNP